MSTIRDVARVAGVSPATVSRVVNGLTGFSEQTRQRVEEAASRLGYEPDTLARGLKTRQSPVLGVLAPVVSDALASQIMGGIEAAARARGYSVMLGRTGPHAVHAPGYLRNFRAFRVAGVIFISTVVTAEIRRALGSRIPFTAVAIRDGSRFPSLAIDDDLAAYDGTRFLQRLGHDTIGLITGDTESVLVNTPRMCGYQRAMAEAGLAPIVAYGDSLYDSAPPAVRTLMTEHPDITAIFALSDEMAAGAINELQRLGYRVPAQVSVLGFDNTPTAQHVHPALTTVTQPLYHMGELAVEQLLSSTRPQPHILPHTITRRGSIADRRPQAVPAPPSP
ncbi:LacI family DNA-binding transcriptional regulator [Streptomyces shenzhenensis]|uniref:LacI family DNA-binding transcriptional regulator n=1 Tax=Streptomyces shenzhenensis TaxID=943815 RepID=UPI0033DDEC83